MVHPKGNSPGPLRVHGNGLWGTTKWTWDQWSGGWGSAWGGHREEVSRDYSAPPSFPGLQYLPVYRDALRRWCDRTAIRASHRAGRILEGFSVELQEKMRQLPREKLDCEDGVDNLLAHLSLLWGERR